METATFIKKLEGWRGYAALYKLSKSIEDYAGEKYDYVIVSAIRNEMAHETFIFPADKDGKAISMGELKGSMQGTTSHAQVLREAGYEIVHE
jgi:hypothetical protein